MSSDSSELGAEPELADAASAARPGTAANSFESDTGGLIGEEGLSGIVLIPGMETGESGHAAGQAARTGEDGAVVFGGVTGDGGWCGFEGRTGEDGNAITLGGGTDEDGSVVGFESRPPLNNERTGSALRGDDETLALTNEDDEDASGLGDQGA